MVLGLKVTKQKLQNCLVSGEGEGEGGMNEGEREEGREGRSEGKGGKEMFKSHHLLS